LGANLWSVGGNVLPSGFQGRKTSEKNISAARGGICPGDECLVLHQSVYAQYVAHKEEERHTQTVHNVADFLRWRSLDEYFFTI